MAGTPSPAPPASPDPAAMGTFQRLAGAIANPKPTFADIAARPSWAAPLILLCVLSIAVIAIFTERVGWRSFMEKQFERNPRTAQLPPDQKEAALENAVKYAGVFGYVGAVVGTAVGAAASAGLLLLAFNLIAGTRVNFKTAFGIVSHAWMPYVISGLLGILLLFIKDPDTIDLEHLVASNPGAFLPGDTARWLLTLATSFDVFVFWSMALMALGFSAAAPKKAPFAKALGIVLGVWAVYVLVKVGWVGAFS